MYPTSCREFFQEEIKLNIWPETAKPQDAGCSHNVEDTRHAMTGSSFQKVQQVRWHTTCNVKPEGSSVKYAINLATSHQYASNKAKANTPLIPFMQGNWKHNNYMQGHFTPSKMQGAVNMIQTQKRTSAYKWRYTEPVYHTRMYLNQCI